MGVNSITKVPKFWCEPFGIGLLIYWSLLLLHMHEPVCSTLATYKKKGEKVTHHPSALCGLRKA
jgi:hypothetical protein